MSTVNWPAVRQALYTLVTGIVAVLGAFGVIAPDRVDGITQAATAAVSAAALILAAANVNRPRHTVIPTDTPGEAVPAPSQVTGTVDTDALAAEAARWELPAGSVAAPGRHRLD